MTVSSTTPVRPQRPDVIDESFDGEAVLVQLRTGCYYALNATASAIWEQLEPGRSANTAAATLGLGEELVAAFVAELATEELVAVADAEAPAGAPAPLAAGTEAPTLQRFTDMQDLLMLDPIHDIDLDGDGWPVAPPTGT